MHLNYNNIMRVIAGVSVDVVSKKMCKRELRLRTSGLRHWHFDRRHQHCRRKRSRFIIGLYNNILNYTYVVHIVN